MFFNPVFFSKPKSTKNWASKSVLGERVYLNRDKIDIPKHHKKPLLKILNAVSSIGMVLAMGVLDYEIRTEHSRKKKYSYSTESLENRRGSQRFHFV